MHISFWFKISWPENKAPYWYIRDNWPNIQNSFDDTGGVVPRSHCHDILVFYIVAVDLFDPHVVSFPI